MEARFLSTVGGFSCTHRACGQGPGGLVLPWFHSDAILVASIILLCSKNGTKTTCISKRHMEGTHAESGRGHLFQK